MLRCKLIIVGPIWMICFFLMPGLAHSQTSRKIHGEVWDGANNHISGVLVRIYRDSQKIGQFRTSSDGQYAISFMEGRPIDTIRYDHTDWYSAVVTSVSGTKDSMINKVLLKAGAHHLSYNQQREFASTLERLHTIDRANGVSEDEFKETYGNSVRKANLRTENLAWWIATHDPGGFIAINDDPVTGEWNASADAPGQSVPFTLKLKLEGDKVTGTSEFPQGAIRLKGTFVGNNLSLSLETPNGPIVMTGKVKDGKIVGGFDFAGQATGKWEATKKN